MKEVGEWFLMALQVLAMALCACLVARMYMEDELGIPHQVCIDGGGISETEAAQ